MHAGTQTYLSVCALPESRPKMRAETVASQHASPGALEPTHARTLSVYALLPLPALPCLQCPVPFHARNLSVYALLPLPALRLAAVTVS
jgi:hypothetical protein